MHHMKLSQKDKTLTLIGYFRCLYYYYYHLLLVLILLISYGAIFILSSSPKDPEVFVDVSMVSLFTIFCV